MRNNILAGGKGKKKITALLSRFALELRLPKKNKSRDPIITGESRQQRQKEGEPIKQPSTQQVFKRFF